MGEQRSRGAALLQPVRLPQGQPQLLWEVIVTISLLSLLFKTYCRMFCSMTTFMNCMSLAGITATPMARPLLTSGDSIWWRKMSATQQKTRFRQCPMSTIKCCLQIWYKEEHYSGEPIFIPNPNGTSEDDGVLLVIVLDGATQLSYLLLLDGQSFETLAEARMDTFIPMSIHGSWYNEIY